MQELVEHSVEAPHAVVEIGKSHYRTEIKSGIHSLVADEPEELGGRNEGMNPDLYLLASLGSCTAITLRMYADRKEWPVDKIRVELSLSVTKSTLQRNTYIKRHITIEGPVTEQQKSRLLQIANKCPVHEMLTNPITISTNML